MISADAAQLNASADSLLRAGKVSEAIVAYRELLARYPDRPDAWYNLGYLERVDRRFETALVSYDQAIARGLKGPEEAFVNRAAILSEHLLLPAEAERELLKALAIAPTFLPAWHNLGQLREDRNDLDGARDAYSSALAIAPSDGRSNARLAALDVFQGQAEAAIRRLEIPLARVRGGAEAAQLEFAMANTLDALGRYDQAFARYHRANAMASAASYLRYDPAVQDRLVDDLIASHPISTTSTFSSPAMHSQSPAPLFICGMFRSGSTLCEQVLARHSRVTAGGEFEEIPMAVASTLAPYPAALDSVAAATLAKVRDSYLSRIQTLFPGADLVTDKRPDNFLHLGLIKTLFPASLIIHTVRNPLDTILSVYFLHFADAVSYSSQMDDIVHYYKSYRRLMAHWQRLYPDIVAFDYDAFVASPLPRTKALLADCGLEWEACCDPMQKVTEEIRTASAWQVRQPVHTRSAGRWRNYASYISDVRAALERD